MFVSKEKLLSVNLDAGHFPVHFNISNLLLGGVENSKNLFEF